MAYLLGSKSCIDSLRVDIDDLQNVIYDIIGKTGSIKCYSWKFPDKLATDVDIKELLERYQFGTNEVDNQVSHVLLFEIVIDRLLLVLHGSWRYLHDIQMKLLPNLIDSSSTINQQTSLSVGLVVKKYWNKILHLFDTLQMLKTRPDDIERVHRKRSKAHLMIEKHCQTIETSFSPCSSCLKLQQYFRDSSTNIIHLCNLYNLPSSLAYHRCSTSIIPEWLSSDDIDQWFDCQLKDFDRLSKHLEYLNTTLNQTKNDLGISEIRAKEQNEIHQRLQRTIREEQQAKKVLQEEQEKKCLDMKKQYEEKLDKLNEEMKLFQQLQRDYQQMQDQWKSREEEMEKLESLKNQLKIMMDDRMKSDQLTKNFEDNSIRLQTELDVVKRDLDERHRDLKKERLRIETMIRQEENSQSKQKLLIKSNEDFSQECQALKKQISQLEYQRDQFQKNQQQTLEEIISLKANIEHLNRPSQIIPVVDNHLQERRANEHRIDLLQKENQSLKSSLEKLLVSNKPPLVPDELRNPSRQQEQSYRSYVHTNEMKPRETPLWLLNTEILEQQQQAFTEIRPVTTANYIPRFSENDYAANGWIKSDSDVIPFQPRPPTRIPSSRALPPAAAHEMTVGKGRSKLPNRPSSFEHTRRNLSSARTRRSSATHITHQYTN